MNVPRSSAEDVLRLFLGYLSVEKGLSRNTILSYGRDLRKFFPFLEREKKDWARADENTLSFFVHRQSQAGLQARSLALLYETGELRMLRGFSTAHNQKEERLMKSTVWSNTLSDIWEPSGVASSMQCLHPI